MAKKACVGLNVLDILVVPLGQLQEELDGEWRGKAYRWKRRAIYMALKYRPDFRKDISNWWIQFAEDKRLLIRLGKLAGYHIRFADKDSWHCEIEEAV